MRWPMLIASAAMELAPTAALAHGGGLDANGCHTNKKTGDYHWHGGGAPSSGGFHGRRWRWGGVLKVGEVP